MNIESKLDIETRLFFVAQLHGVEPVDKKKKLNWKSYREDGL